MTARANILAKLRAAGTLERAEVEDYHPQLRSDLKTEFVSKAEAADVVIHEIASAEELPASLQSILVDADDTAPLHIAHGSALRELPWERAPNLTLHDAPPAGEAIALSAADFAIAESGTLAFQSGAARPSSWYFLPGIECVLVYEALIVPTLEDLFARLADKALPATLNLVTGPSRTADIEQTIERGAHGPRAVHIFLSAD